MGWTLSSSPTALGLTVVFLTQLAAARTAEVTLDQVLGAKPADRARLVQEIADEGPAGVRCLQAEVAGRVLSESEHGQIEAFLVNTRAKLMGTSAADVRKLDRVGDYRRKAVWEDENEFLCRLLDGPAGRTDFGRAQVIEAFLRRYTRLAELPSDERWRYVGTVNPREVVRRLRRQPVGPELGAVLDEHLAVLLYHEWVSRIRGIRKLISEFICSPVVPRSTYETLRDVYVDSIRGNRPPRIRRTTDDVRTRDAAHPLRLRRDEPEAWPALDDDYTEALWQAPVARDEDRELIWRANLDVLLSNSADTAREAGQRIHRLLCLDAVPEQMTHAALSRTFELRDRLESRRRARIGKAFEPYLRQVPLSKPYAGSDYCWRQILAWWDGGGHNASPSRPLAQPLKAVACVALASGGDSERLTLLYADTAVEPEETAVTMRATPWGTFLFTVRARQLVDDKDALFVRWTCDLLRPDSFDPAVEKAPRYYVPGERVINGIHAYLAYPFAYNPDGPSHPGLVVMLIDRPKALQVPHKADLDWVFAEFYKRYPPGKSIPGMGGFPDGQERFLPLKHRLMIAERYYDGLGPPPPRSGSSPRDRLRRVAPFATRSGGTEALAYLREWVGQKWPGWQRLEPVLRECEELAKAAAAAGAGTAGQIAAIRDVKTRSSLLRALMEPERLGKMPEHERLELARAIVLEVLAREQDPGERARLDHALRKLTGKEFGYNPFATAEGQQEAIDGWIRWAREQP